MKNEIRVLVVDDDKALADSLARLLHLRGYDVKTAHDGVEALRIDETFAPDCVVLDLAMPNMSGAELAEALRERHGANVVLVVVSGRPDMTVDSADLVLVDHWLRKPVDPEALYLIFPDISSA